jgi:threonine/homoserine/homoserine lactone efflux protein
MCDERTLAPFVAASAAIILAPGPAQALVIARTLEQGTRAGMMTALGLNAATLVHAVFAGLGLSALLATSALAFGVLKLVGAAYLVYLGVRALVVPSVDLGRGMPPPGPQRAALQAFFTGLLNPKVALFFLAFLPQFVCPARGSVLLQCLMLGALLGAMDVLYESGIILLVAKATTWLDSPRVALWRSRLTGAVLIGLGVKLALAERG